MGMIGPRQACLLFTQIRAGNLSGDCHFKREIARFYFNIQKQHQVRLCHVAGNYVYRSPC